MGVQDAQHSRTGAFPAEVEAAAEIAQLPDPLPLDYEPRSATELLACLKDPLWRVCSGHLYKIMTKSDKHQEGSVVRFRPNRAQRKFLAELHTRNVILKARQLGFCLDRGARVLTADLRWVRIDTLRPGDEVVSVDEHVPGGRGSARKMRTATVQATNNVRREGYRIRFADGRSVVCTAQHPWLARSGIKRQPFWRAMDRKAPNAERKLAVGHQVRSICTPWGYSSFEDGWFGGMIDGEGSLSLPSRSGASVCIAQRPGPAWERMVEYATSRGYHYRIEADDSERLTKYGKVPVPKIVFGRTDELFRLIGQTRPTRGLERAFRFWEGKELPGKRNADNTAWNTIVAIEPVGMVDMVDLQTSTGTFIAEGMVSHNTTLISIYFLDHAIFNDDQRCGVIAHSLEDAGVIFRDKAKFAYDNLPQVVKDLYPLKSSNESEMLFHNNSAMRVAVSMRSGTIQRLHVSEMGKIAARFPQKAEEIVKGSLPAVPDDGIAIIESTAEGQEGKFFDIADRAEKRSYDPTPLGAKEFKFHFFPWFITPEYATNPRHVRITPEQHEYFDKVEAEMGVRLKLPQRAWYVTTLENEQAGDSEGMWREYPSCVVGSTRVATPNGLVPIRDLEPDGETITHHYDQGEKDVFHVTTEMGYRVTCTADHPILCADGDFRKIEDGLSVGADLQLARPSFGGCLQSVKYCPIPLAETKITVSEDVAEFLGLFMGDGSFHDGTISIVCDARDKDVIERARNLMQSLFGTPYQRSVGKNGGGTELRVSRKGSKEPLIALGAITKREHATAGWKRRVQIPPEIFQSPPRVVAKFLSGLFEADGYVRTEGNSLRLFSKDPDFLRDVQLLLLMFDIPSWTVEKTRNMKGKTYQGNELRLRVKGIRAFTEKIGFIGKRKNDCAAQSNATPDHHNQKPFVWTDKIASIVSAGKQQVYDITTATARFNANGIMVHNCPAECWMRSTEGTWYAPQLARARAEGRICPILHVSNVPVHTFWDIGSGDGTGIWAMQDVGTRHRFIRYFEDWAQGYGHYVKLLRDTGWLFGIHYLPHDATHERQMANTVASPLSLLQELAPDWRFEIVPRVPDITQGIQMTREAFPEMWFNVDGSGEDCEAGIRHIDLYKKKWNSRLGVYSDEPEKLDGHSEAADALRQYAQGYDPAHFLAPTAPKRRSRGAMTV